MNRTSLLALPLALAGGGCGSEFTSEELVGTWQATQIVFINEANRSQQVDLVAEGAALTLAFSSDGRYLLTVTQNAATDTEGGSWEVADGQLVMRGDIDPDPVVYDVTISGNNLTANTQSGEYDFDHDGHDDPADFHLVALRAYVQVTQRQP